MNIYLKNLDASRRLLELLPALEPALQQAADLALETLRRGGKILLAGNGGSASEAQHLAGELVGRYLYNRQPLAALALSADSGVLTCIGNDFGYDDLFARQLRALARPGDLFVLFSSSGNSPNLVRALEAAAELGIPSVAFLGKSGGPCLPLATCPLLVSHPDTARVQEAHQLLMHSLMDLIEAALPLEISK